MSTPATIFVFAAAAFDLALLVWIFAEPGALTAILGG